MGIAAPGTADAYYLLGQTTGNSASNGTTNDSRGWLATTANRSYMQVIKVGWRGGTNGGIRMGIYAGNTQGSNLLVDFGEFSYTGGGSFQEFDVPAPYSLPANTQLCIVMKTGTAIGYYGGTTTGTDGGTIRAFDGNGSSTSFASTLPSPSTTTRSYDYYIAYDVIPNLGSMNDTTLDNSQSGVVITGGGFENQNEFSNNNSKVYIATGSTWASHGTLQEQTVTSWPNDGGGSSSTITFTVVKGSIPDGTAYVYVQNDDGEVNPGGYAVTMNSSSVPGLTVGTNSAVVNSTSQITVTATFAGDTNTNSSTTIDYGTSGSGPWTPKCIGITTGSPRVCVVDGLQSNTQYWFRITHTDSDGVTGTNPEVIGPYTTSADNVLAVGTNSAAVNSSSQITVTATFTGDDNANSSTQVEYNTSDSWPGTVKCASISSGSPRVCVVDGLEPGTQYWFLITHTDADGVTGTNPEVIGPYTTQSLAPFGCGSCHGSTTKSPAYESAGLPLAPDACNDLGRGLHGTHNNYSSASFRMSASGTRGNCDYCHTTTATTAPTATHNNGYINITGSIVTGRQAMDTTGLDYNSDTDTCTNACHNNRGTTAPWGNYTGTTPVAVELSCRSCHDDVTDKASSNLSGAHGAHLMTAISTVGTAMGASGDAGCVNCHPDNRNDLWSAGKADDGTKKAYPHASDGTNVIFDNASVISTVSATRVPGSGDTCANACHRNTTTAAWSDAALGCNACHYYGGPDKADPPTFTGNSSAIVRLQGKHGSHIAAGKNCSDCHSVPLSNGDTSHVTALPVTPGNAAVTRVGMTFDRVTDPANPTCTFGGSGAGSGCHGDNQTTPSWYFTGTLDCDTCHSYPNSGNDWTAGNGHLVRYDPPVIDTHMLASGYDPVNDEYDIITADTSRCGFCHAGGTHRNGTIDVSSAGRGYNNCTTTDFTINVNTSGSDVTCSNVSCHSGVDTPNWY